MIVFLVALVGFSALVIASTTETKWRLLNVATIVAYFGLGIAIGKAVGFFWIHDVGRDATMPLAIFLAFVGAIACHRRNLRREYRARQSAGMTSATNANYGA
jgi:hypothetical protein